MIGGRAVLRCNKIIFIQSITLLGSVFESPGDFSPMSDTLRKRGRELQADSRDMSETLRKRGRGRELQVDSRDVQEPKRFHCEETEPKTLADDRKDKECATIEEIVKGIMRSLEEEIAATCSTFYFPSISGNNTTASDISRKLESDTGVDLSYLLGPSDDDLGIPTSPVLDSKDGVCISLKKETSEGLLNNPNLQYFCEKWNSENCQQNVLCEEAWDARALHDSINRDFFQ